MMWITSGVRCFYCRLLRRGRVPSPHCCQHPHAPFRVACMGCCPSFGETAGVWAGRVGGRNRRSGAG
eukprot:3342219-Pyramimonas_sp.AAC.1